MRQDRAHGQTDNEQDQEHPVEPDEESTRISVPAMTAAIPTFRQATCVQPLARGIGEGPGFTTTMASATASTASAAERPTQFSQAVWGDTGDPSGHQRARPVRLIRSTMPKFTTLSHLDLSVSDVERSASWYVETLGLERLGRSDLDNRIMIVLRHRETGLIIGLIQHHEQTAGSFDERRPGLDHLGFEVADRADLDELQSRLVDLGVDHSPVTDAPSGSGTALVFRDPDNIQLEFWWPRPRA